MGLLEDDNPFYRKPKSLDEILTDTIQESFEKKLTHMIDKMDEKPKRPMGDRVIYNVKRTMRDSGRNKVYKLHMRRNEKESLKEYTEMSDYLYDKIKRKK